MILVVPKVSMRARGEQLSVYVPRLKTSPALDVEQDHILCGFGVSKISGSSGS